LGIKKHKKIALEEAVVLLHSILFAYQKSVRDILRTGDAIFVDPVIDTINKLHRKIGVSLSEGRNVDEVMENYAKRLMMRGLVKKSVIEKQSEEEYMLKIEGCALNRDGKVHELLKPKDVTCPWGIIAQAIYSKSTGKKVAVTDSAFEKDLSATGIKPRR
jgi:hypothetical protein